MFLLTGGDMVLFQFLIPESKGQTLKDIMPPPEERLFAPVKKRSIHMDSTVHLTKDNDKYAIESNL